MSSRIYRAMKKSMSEQHIRWNARSLQVRFFLSIVSAVLVFVVLLSVLNLLFFNQYQTMQKKHSLSRVYKEIYSSYYGDVSLLNDILYELEANYNIRISIINDYGKYIYDTINPNELFASFASGPFENGRTIIYYDEEQVEERGYTFSIITDNRGQATYLALIGRLQTDETLLLRVPYATMQQERSFSFVFLMISALVALLVCLAFGLILSRHFAQPLYEMTEVANSVARLDFSKKYSGRTTTTEIEQLGESINKMSDYLDHAITDLQDVNDRLEAEIQKKQQIDDMRKEFIVNISHELKTPIALIQGYAEGLRVGINESEEDKNYYCDTIIDEAHHMNRMVLQLLNLSKIELGSTVPIYTDIELYELAENVISKTRVMWQEKQLHMDLSGIGEQTVCADWDMMEQAVTNYVTNAIDHTPSGGWIWLSTEEDSSHYIFRVRNQGAKLDEEDMEKIWDKFYKLDKARKRITGGGSGIGLSIVRAMMTAHHGGCGVHNTEDGVEFYLTLPKQPPCPDGTEQSG